MKILIADDDKVVHLTYSKPLEEKGFEVFNAYDGLETIEMIHEKEPDIVVLDISMPGSDGRDLCKQLKSSPETRDIKIIMLTAKVSHSDRILGLKLGVDDYLEKPCPLYFLVRSIEKIIAGMD